MARMFHGAHTRFTTHRGLCLTDDIAAALVYADEHGTIAHAEVDFGGLRVVEVDGYNHDANVAIGDDGNDHGADVLVFGDEDASGRQHTTWRLMSDAAVARFAAATASAALVRTVRGWWDASATDDEIVAEMIETYVIDEDEEPVVRAALALRNA